ncbi:MAG: integrin alpha [Candidatus Methylomirabilis sp.]|nr:integrin alpha [Deltaproteobacteria bacterium]
MECRERSERPSRGVRSRWRVVSTLFALALAHSLPASANSFATLKFYEEHGCDGFGLTLASLGDVTGDGVNEIVVGAPFYSDQTVNLGGKVYVFSGSDGALIRSFVGRDYELMGSALATPGDLDGDGFPDLAAGAPYWDFFPDVQGRVYVYSVADGRTFMKSQTTKDRPILTSATR